MPPNKAERVLQQIGVQIEHPTRKGGALSPKQQLCITLHWLGSGSQYHTIADMHGIHKSTVCRSIKNVVHAVNTLLFNRVVTWPENIENVVEQSYRVANFLYVCGIIDGSLIPIDAPPRRRTKQLLLIDGENILSTVCLFVDLLVSSTM